MKYSFIAVPAFIVCALVAGCSSDDKTTPNPNPDGGETGAGGKSGGGATSSGGKSTSSGGATTGTGGKAAAGGKAGTDTDAGMDGGMPAMPTLGKQIDRMGRPAINTALNNVFNPDAASKGTAKDAYNDALPATWGTFKAEFQKNLAILDALDANCGNQLKAGATATADRYSFLATVLTDDQLYVNTAASECGVYLGVEAEAVEAVPAGGGKCGGRTPKDDVIDRSYSVLAAGLLTGVDDNITEDDGAQTATFPFLGEPTLSDSGS